MQDNKIRPKASYPQGELWWLLSQTRHALARARNNEVAQFGITLTEGAVLFVVNNLKGPITPSKLSRILFREPVSMAQLLRRMENKGYLKRVKGMAGKNGTEIILTEKGKNIINKLSQTSNVIVRAFSCFSPEEFETLGRLLLTLRNHSLGLLEETRLSYSPQTSSDDSIE